MSSILETKEISKSFNGIEVLHSVDFSLTKGEIHAIVGENGAGKSTFMKILMGEYKPEKGNIKVNGKKVNISTPAQALSLGIAMVHQELHYMPFMSIADYMYLGREPRNFLFNDTRKKLELTIEQLSNINFELDPNLKMGQLSVSEIQMIEIAKVISYGSQILILDEPTSSLSENEVEKLFEILNLLRSSGVAVIYISHRLEELYRIADNVTILRDGFKVHSSPLHLIEREEIINKMVGRTIEELFPEKNKDLGNVILEARNLTRHGDFKDINFKLREGEVLGIAGLVGAGRTEIAAALFGENKLHKGEIFIKGKPLKIKNSIDAFRNKMAFVTEDRKKSGLNLIGSIHDNMTLVILRDSARMGYVNRNKTIDMTTQMMDKLNIKARSRDQTVRSLSGGNQQKVVLGKWILTEPDIFILDEPTRGIDIGAKTEIYGLIKELTANGKAVILISSELPEIVRLAHKVIVLHEGKQTGELSDNEITQEKIMMLASG